MMVKMRGGYEVQKIQNRINCWHDSRCFAGLVITLCLSLDWKCLSCGLVCANTVLTMSGNILNMSGAEVNPSPMLSERLAIIMLRCENPQRAIMPKLAKTMLPNIIKVQPPRTHCGIVANNAPIGGNSPHNISITAPVAIVKRLITLDKAARPTF